MNILLSVIGGWFLLSLLFSVAFAIFGYRLNKARKRIHPHAGRIITTEDRMVA